MILLLISVIWLILTVGLAVILWLRVKAYVVLQPGGFSAENSAPSINIIVPARNESLTIARCLSGLMAQSYPRDKLSIIVVDDESTDDTADIVQRLTQSDPRVRLIEAGPLPSGWVGKPHACWVGAESAGPSDWLCFVDADTYALPEALRTAVEFAQTQGIDMLSLHPFQELGTVWERLVIPEGFFMLALSTDMNRINNPALPDASANGQFYIIRRQVYETIGGHAAVRTRILEDMALAQAVKAAGYRLHLMGGNALVRTRMYSSLAALWEGMSKMAAELVARNLVGATLVAIVMFLLGWMPVGLSVLSAINIAIHPSLLHNLTLMAAIIGWAIMIGIHLWMAAFFRIPFFYGFLFSLGFTLSAAGTLNSVWQRIAGRNTWRGRRVSLNR